MAGRVRSRAKVSSPHKKEQKKTRHTGESEDELDNNKSKDDDLKDFEKTTMTLDSKDSI